VPRLVAAADRIYIANLRGGLSFAVADAYRNWYDVSLEEAQRLLADARRGAADTEGRACTSTN
jgi:predicted phosphoribosyltransferase